MKVEVFNLEGELKATFTEVAEYTVDQSKGLPLIDKITEDKMFVSDDEIVNLLLYQSEILEVLENLLLAKGEWAKLKAEEKATELINNHLAAIAKAAIAKATQ